MEHCVTTQDEVKWSGQAVRYNVVLLKISPTCSLELQINFESAHLECPLLLPKCLLVFVNVSLSDVISVELDICPVVEEVRHPVHVPAGGVQEADLVLVKDLLEVISD